MEFFALLSIVWYIFTMTTNIPWYHNTSIDPIWQRLLDAQKEWAYIRVREKRKVISDLFAPPVTPQDEELAKEWRAKIFIDQWNTLYLRYSQKLRELILSYLQNLSIDDPTRERVERVVTWLEYSTTYDDESKWSYEVMGESWWLTINITDIYHIPLDISIYQVQRYMIRNFLHTVSTKVTTPSEAIEIQYLMILLHEFVHAASIRIHTLTDGEIWRIGVQLLEMNGKKFGEYVQLNETLTDIIAGKIYDSDAFQEAFPLARKVLYTPGYTKLLPTVIEALEWWWESRWLSSQEAMVEMQRLYFSPEIDDVLEIHRIFHGLEFPQWLVHKM